MKQDEDLEFDFPDPICRKKTVPVPVFLHFGDQKWLEILNVFVFFQSCIPIWLDDNIGSIPRVLAHTIWLPVTGYHMVTITSRPRRCQRCWEHVGKKDWRFGDPGGGFKILNTSSTGWQIWQYEAIRSSRGLPCFFVFVDHCRPPGYVWMLRIPWLFKVSFARCLPCAHTFLYHVGNILTN